MDQVVYVPAKEILCAVIAQHRDADRIAEGALAVDVDAVDRLGRRIEEKADLFLTLPLRLLGPLALGDVGVNGDRAAIGRRRDADLDDPTGEQPALVPGRLPPANLAMACSASSSTSPSPKSPRSA
jgi:hypothetical protein